jgi:hypothetical protein
LNSAGTWALGIVGRWEANALTTMLFRQELRPPFLVLLATAALVAGAHRVLA